MIASSATIDPSRVLNDAIAALNGRAPQLPLADVDRALQVAPNDPRLWHIKGLIHREQDQRELAIPALERASRLAPQEPLIAHGYARTLLEAGLPCVEEFGRALKLAPDNSEVVKGLVSALAAQGRTSEAIEGLELALRRSPLWTDGHVLLAAMRWANGERKGFTRSYDEAIAIHPSSMELRRQQLIALLEVQHFDDAMERIESGRAKYGEQLVFASHEAVIRSERGEIELGDRLFEELVAVDSPHIAVRHVRHLLQSGRPLEASKLIDRWLDTEDMFWPYAATAWRITADPRSEWLEGDERFVRTYDLADRIPALDRLAEVLRGLHVFNSEFHSQSVRGGTQTDGHLFQRIEPEIVALREAIRETVAEHAAQLPPVDPKHPLLRWRPQRIEFTGAWSVRLLAGGHHSAHVHPMGWLSSAFYIALPPDLGRDQAGWLTLGEPDDQLGVSLPPLHTIEPKLGLLALFPSGMWHGTRPFGAGERLTVAFDVARGG